MADHTLGAMSDPPMPLRKFMKTVYRVMAAATMMDKQVELLNSHEPESAAHLVRTHRKHR